MLKNKRASRNRTCPCGSGSKYKECCLKKGIRWHLLSDGSVRRAVELDDEAMNIFKDQKDEFVRIFQRQPMSDDLIFFFAYKPIALSQSNFINNALDRAEISPAIKFAYNKTGLLITDKNEKKLPIADLQEWEEAIQEYYEFEDLILAQAECRSRLKLQIERYPYILGRFIKNANFDVDHYSSSDTFKNQFHQMMLFANKTLKSFCGVESLLESGWPEEVLNLSRSIYENYLHSLQCLYDPLRSEELAKAKCGLICGDYEYKKHKNGKLNRREAVEVSTGRSIILDVSTFTMVGCSPFDEDKELHESIYSFLSRYVHPHFLTLTSYAYDESLHVDQELVSFESEVFALLFGALVLDSLYQMRFNHDIVETDLQVFFLDTRNVLDEVIELITFIEDAASLKTRVGRLGTKWPHK